jgi:hypothetical protein
VPGDFIAHLTGTRVEPVERLALGTGTGRFYMTRGTMRSTLVMMRGGDVTYKDGSWRSAPGRIRRPKMRFPPRRATRPDAQVPRRRGHQHPATRPRANVDVSTRADAGVLAPAHAFDAADFLEFLAPFGVTWSVALQEVQERAAA